MELPLDNSSNNLNLVEKLPEGIEIEKDLTPELMRSIIKQFCVITTQEIQEDIKQGKEVKLIFPLDGGFLVYWELKKYLKENYPEVYWQVEFLFAAKNRILDENGKSDYVVNKRILNGDKVVFYNIDDMFDSKDSDDKIRKYVKSKFKGEYEFKTRVVSTKDGKDYFETQMESPHFFRFQNKWVTSGFGMNSGMVDAMIEAYERICGISFYIIEGQENFVRNWTLEERNQYLNILIDNCYFQDYFERSLVLEHLKELMRHNGNHRSKFEAMEMIHES